ncbi:adrenocorticotropic hormone receptor-like [Orbicella faveolata]|uniref:adrenocorticotropic hormone receptor-like n=1 Tax=Orbicella faveolata TaxID=48498 RepID=UPI0009E256C3|nr:adrenocorticotropic hormone receptor-like [Orbicella faveolata]
MANSSSMLNITTQCPSSGPTVSTEREILEQTTIVILCTVLGVASFLGTLGNSLVLSSIMKFDDLREIPDLFIFSLSMSDFLVTAIYQPLKNYRLANLDQVSTQMELFAISRFLGFFSLIASITNMFGVTVERLISIRFPMKYDLVVTRRRAVITLICIWIFSFTLVILVSTELLSLMLLSTYFTMVLLGTVSIYLYIFLIARKVENSVIQIQNGSLDHEVSNNKRKRKAAKTIAIILGVSVGCWLPFLIFSAVLSKTPDTCTSNRCWKCFYSLQLLSVCNSSINPYIYCARNRRYFAAFVKLLGLQKICRVQASVTPAYSPRSAVAIGARAAPAEIQAPQAKGEIIDVAL